MCNFVFQILLLVFGLWFIVECKCALTESELKDYLEITFEKDASDLCYRANVAEFAYAVDLKNKTKEQIVVRNKITFSI